MAKAKVCPECDWKDAEIKRLDGVVKKLKKAAAPEAPKAGLHYRNFSLLWEEYPEKKGKHEAWLKFKSQVTTPEDLININKALENYKADMVNVREQHPDRPWLHGSTWFNYRWQDFIDYQTPAKLAAAAHKIERVVPLDRADYVDPAELQKLVKSFNRDLKSAPRASNKFVEPK